MGLSVESGFSRTEARFVESDQPASPPQEPEGEPQLGDVSWHELYTTDADAALDFSLRC
jgi:hypothetical protein